MTKKLIAIALGLLIGAIALAAGPYPTLVLKNQFGEKSINSVLMGTNQVDLSFSVDATQGAGISNLTSFGQAPNATANVFMHTTTTPAAGNPNPAVGYMIVQLSSNYAGFVSGYYNVESPQYAATPIAVSSPLPAFSAYVISSVGTTTGASWSILGLAPGVTPFTGTPFIVPSPAPSAQPGTGTIYAPGVTGIQQLEFVGNPNTGVAATGGAYFVLQAIGATSSSTTTPIPVAPTRGTVFNLRFVMTALGSQLK